MSPVKISLLAAGIFFSAGLAQADEPDQNAFTRAVKGPLSGIVTPVANPHSEPCNGVVDCRRKRSDLKTVWQVNHTGDQGPTIYPAPCRKTTKNGKYVYDANDC